MSDFIKEYVDYCGQITDAPLVYHEFMALGTVASAVAGGVYCKFGASRLKPNIYMVLVGSSSVFRKTTCLNISRQFVRAAGGYIYPNEFSTERLYEELAGQPEGSFYFSEFASLTGLMSRDYMLGCKAFLTSLYDCERYYSRKLKSGEVEIEEPCVNIFSASTIDWFLARAREGDLAGGFLPRFIFVPATEKTSNMAFPPAADESHTKQIVNWLKAIGEVKGEAVFGEKARRIYSAWQRHHDRYADSPLLSGFITRLQAYALKFAILQNIANEASLDITEKSVHDACVRVDFLTRQLKRLETEEFAFSREQHNRLNVLKALRKAESMTRSELLRTSRLSSRQLDRVLTTLIESELVSAGVLQGESPNRKTRVYRLIGHSADA